MSTFIEVFSTTDDLCSKTLFAPKKYKNRMEWYFDESVVHRVLKYTLSDNTRHIGRANGVGEQT